MAAFYAEVFGFAEAPGNGDPTSYHLTDGRVTLAILPWSMSVFDGMAIKRPGPEHIGFKVEDMEAFKTDAAKLAGANPYLAPTPLGGGGQPGVGCTASAVRDEFDG
jgi:hypothetical protein